METRLAIQDWDALVVALDDSNSEMEHYLDRLTGEILSFTRESVSAAEDDNDDEPTSVEWLRTEIDTYRRVLDEGARYLYLEQNENPWDRMANFVATVDDERLAARLRRAIHGKGAF